jgi:hypothetical protein
MLHVLLTTRCQSLWTQSQAVLSPCDHANVLATTHCTGFGLFAALSHWQPCPKDDPSPSASYLQCAKALTTHEHHLAMHGV